MYNRQKIEIAENIPFSIENAKKNEKMNLTRVENVSPEEPQIKGEPFYQSSSSFSTTAGPLFNTPACLPNTYLSEYKESILDLTEHLMLNSDNTFFVRIHNDSMIDIGIYPGNLLVVDRSLRPYNGKVIIAVLNGELTVKRFFKEQEKIFLMSENTAYPTIEVLKEEDFMIWGVVTNVIHSL